MKRSLLFLILSLILASCSAGGAGTTYVSPPEEPTTAELVGDVALIGTWVKETTGDGRIFTEDAEFLFNVYVTGEVNWSGTYYAHDGQIDFVEEDGTEFIYFYEIVYDDPAVNNVTLYLTPEWVPDAGAVPFRKIIPGFYEYP